MSLPVASASDTGAIGRVTSLTRTLLLVSVAPAAGVAVSVTETVNPMVSVAPLKLVSDVGWNTRDRNAACAAAPMFGCAPSVSV